MSTTFTIISPTSTQDKLHFSFSELAVRDSLQGVSAGKGLFARRPLRRGTIIPIWGKPVLNWTSYPHRQSHGWERVGREKLRLDGHPSHHTFQDAGYFGLAIAMMANEPTGLVAPNCIFRLNSLVVQTDIQAGEELTVYYGDVYPRPYAYQELILANPLRVYIDHELLEDLADTPSVSRRVRDVYRTFAEHGVIRERVRQVAESVVN